MNVIKILIRKLFGKHGYIILRRIKSYFDNLFALIHNTYIDGRLYYKHSMVFEQDTYNKIESRIILNYHGIEKGFIHEKLRFRFGENTVKELVKLLKNEDVIKNRKQTQISVAYLSMCKYYEIHQINDVDISDYYKEDDYDYFKNLSTLDFDIIKTNNFSSFFEDSKSDFSQFSKSRGSVRSFTGEMIPFKTITKVIELAKTAPSVCNRQPAKVYYVECKEIIDKILTLQRGLRGFSEDITQLFILVVDRNYFYTVGERNQLYIDGGLFLMNLLYALHYYKIGACPAHWGFNYKQDEEIKKILNLKDSEKVICLIAIGMPTENIKTTLSLRRSNEEILKVVN